MCEVTATQVGANIRRLRKQVGYEQTKLAAFANLHPAQIAHYERGDRMPTIQNLVKIAYALRYSVQYLIFGEEYDPGLDLRDIDPEAQYILRQLANKFRADEKMVSLGKFYRQLESE